MHRLASNKFDYAIEKIRHIQENARKSDAKEASIANWPVILLKTPKGWTGPKEYNKKVIEGSFRSHQIPLPVSQYNMEDVDILENWLKSYRPEELFTKEGKLVPELLEIAPKHERLMSLNPVTNGGGKDVISLNLPDWKEYSLKIEVPGCKSSQDMVEFGNFARDIIKKILITLEYSVQMKQHQIDYKMYSKRPIDNGYYQLILKQTNLYLL